MSHPIPYYTNEPEAGYVNKNQWTVVSWLYMFVCAWVCFIIGNGNLTDTLTALHMAVHNINSYTISHTVLILCMAVFQYAYSVLMEEYPATINVRRKNNFLIDSAEDLYGGDCL